ncbi:hypothetical protein BGZ94_009392 [Podila epigama]|nr:hypothetical protein BGZ94_009392 [Podila epigama]
MQKIDAAVKKLHESNTADASVFANTCADFEDILPSDLHDTLSQHLHIPYLQESDDTLPLPHVQGIVWGSSLRQFISLNVQIDQPILTLSGSRLPIHVHFLYIAPSPQTFLSDQALKVLGLEDMVVVGHQRSANDGSSMRLPLKINGFPILVARSPPESHFAHLNILGQDFIQISRADVFFGGHIPRFQISFPELP